MSGLGFSLSSKRPAPGARPGQPKKPVTVQDLFGGAGSDDEDAGAAKRSRGEPSAAELASRLDKEVVEVASKLADFVAKNGDQYETMTRERNPGEGPFKFLHDKSSPGYRFYAAKVRELKAPAGTAADASGGRGRAPSFSPPPSAPPPPSRHQSHQHQHQPRSAPYPARSGSGTPQPGTDPVTAEQEAEERRRAQLAMAKGDAVAAMEAFAALAAKRDAKRERSADPDELEDEERRKRAEPLLNKTAFERRRTTAVYKDDGSRGHHMGDYIPKEVLVDFMAKTGDQVAQAQAKELENKDAIGSDNIGHKLLQKMGWREGDALGGTQKGITQPIKAAPAAPAPGEARGLGATAHGEVSADDDPFEAYRKRMMLGYKYRPNPLGNPRRAYY